MWGAPAPSAALAALLDRDQPEVRGLVCGCRQLLYDALPNPEESIDVKGGLIGYGYGAGYKGAVATLILSKQGVKLGIVNGAQVPDPRQLMRGAGKGHRHVPIDTTADLRQAGLKTLLKSAYAAWKRRKGGT